MSSAKPTIWRTLRQAPTQPESVAPAVAAQVARERLVGLLADLEPARPLALAAFLNGTPNLTSLDQLASGEVAAMLERLIGAPTYTVALWQRHLDERHEKDWGGELR